MCVRRYARRAEGIGRVALKKLMEHSLGRWNDRMGSASQMAPVAVISGRCVKRVELLAGVLSVTSAAEGTGVIGQWCSVRRVCEGGGS